MRAAKGQPESAAVHLDEALAMARDVKIPTLIPLCAAHRVLLPDGDIGAAHHAFEQYGPRLGMYDRMEAAFALWKATGDPQYVEMAQSLLCHLRDHAPEDCRDSMIENVPLHRDIMKAWEEHA